MSLQSKKYKKAFNRAEYKLKVEREAAQHEKDFEDAWRDYYLYEGNPSPFEFRWGFLLNLLQKLNIKEADNLLAYWNW